eukprot:467717-Amphidinium_carterae.1
MRRTTDWKHQQALHIIARLLLDAAVSHKARALDTLAEAANCTSNSTTWVGAARERAFGWHR